LHSIADANEMLLKGRPVIRPKLKNSNPALCQVLLMPKILIGDYHQLKAFGFCTIEQFAIPASAPPQFDCG